MEEENTCKHISELLDEVLESLIRPLDGESKKKIGLQAEALKSEAGYGYSKVFKNSLDSR